jgi:hypothetical protein
MTTEQANAPPARVVVRRRVRLSSYPQGARGSRPPKNGPGGVVPRKMSEGAERRQAHQQFHACEARRASCAVDKFTQSAQTSTRHARLSALHRGDFGRRDCSDHHPDRPFGLLIPRAFARVRPRGRLPTMASPRSRARQYPEAPGDGLRDHPQAPHPLRHQDASRWRPRMSRQQQDTELFSEKGHHARDVPGSVQELGSMRKNLCVSRITSTRTNLGHFTM